MNTFKRQFISVTRRFRRVSDDERRELHRKHAPEWLQKPGVHTVGEDKRGLVVFATEVDDDIHAYSLSPLKVIKCEPFAVRPPTSQAIFEKESKEGFVAEAITRTARLRPDGLGPVVGGVSIGHKDIPAGSLGLLVRDKTTKKPLILSNNHVFAAINKGRNGDEIVQPGIYDGGKVATDTIAYLERFIPLANGCKADAAVAKPINNLAVRIGVLGMGYAFDWIEGKVGQLVKKSGRTSGYSKGKIIAVNVSSTVDYGDRNYTLEGQIVSDIYSAPGDSGSAIQEVGTNRFIGLLFAGNGAQTLISPAKAIFDGLNVELIPCPYPLLADLSHYNGPILNVGKLFARVKGIFHKATEGDYYADDQYVANTEICKAGGVPVTPYHFNSPKVSYQAQYNWFTSHVSGLPALPPMVDFEKTDGKTPAQITGNAQKLMALVDGWSASFGLRSPFIYTRGSWWNPYILRWSGWQHYPVYVARYDVDLPQYPSKDTFWVTDWPQKIEWRESPSGALMFLKDTVWQFTADGNQLGAQFGVASTSIDLGMILDESVLLPREDGGELPPDEPPIEKGKVVTMAGLNVRKEPRIVSGNVVSKLAYGALVDLLEYRVIDGNTWVRIGGEGRWCAMVYRGSTYIKKV